MRPVVGENAYIDSLHKDSLSERKLKNSQSKDVHFPFSPLPTHSCSSRYNGPEKNTFLSVDSSLLRTQGPRSARSISDKFYVANDEVCV